MTPPAWYAYAARTLEREQLPSTQRWTKIGELPDGRPIFRHHCADCYDDPPDPPVCHYWHPLWRTPCGQPPDAPIHTMVMGLNYSGRMRHNFDRPPVRLDGSEVSAYFPVPL